MARNLRHLRTEADAAPLMPPYQGGGFHVVLFWRTSDANAGATLNKFASMNWGILRNVSALDVDAVPSVAQWFGISETPTVAVILDGALLCVEQGCEPGACQRLERWALQQHTLLSI